MTPDPTHRLVASPAHDLDWAIDHCVRIAAAGGNNLSQAAAMLEDPTKYRLFAVTYAAMRVLDDAVDVDFLSRPAAERVATRGETLALVDRWLAQVEAAERGRFTPGRGTFEPLVFTALDRFLGRSQIALGPWRRLAASLRRDVEERSLETWEDFLSYGEGACVAPGAVFIYVLACETGDGDRTTLRLPRPVESYARDLALFCYLVHIVRDLRGDAARNRQLLTVPRELLDGAGLTPQTLADAALRGDRARLIPVISSLLREAGGYTRRAEQEIGALAPHLPARETEVLSHLFALYRRTFDGLRAAWL